LVESEADALEGYPWPQFPCWVIGRELTLFDSIDLSGVPRPHRANALAQKIRSLSPFQKTGYHVVEQDGISLVWVWDEDRRTQLLSDVDRELVVLPESLLYPKGKDEDSVIRLAEGYEKQTWRDGRLIESLWERSQPIDADVKQTPANRGWYLELLPDEDSVSEALLWRGGAWILIALLVFQSGNYLGWLREESQVLEDIQRSRLEASETLKVRESARTQLAKTTKLLEWLSHPSQLALVAEIDKRMPVEAQLKTWTYQGRQLQLTVTDPNLDNRAYVEELSSSSRFVEVRIEPGSTPDSAKLEVSLAN